MASGGAGSWYWQWLVVIVVVVMMMVVVWSEVVVACWLWPVVHQTLLSDVGGRRCWQWILALAGVLPRCSFVRNYDEGGAKQETGTFMEDSKVKKVEGGI